MFAVDIIDFGDVNRVVLWTLVGEVGILKRKSLACVSAFLVEGLVQRVLQEPTFDLVYIYLVCSDVPNRESLLVQVRLQIEQVFEFVCSLSLLVDLPLGNPCRRLDVDLPVLYVPWHVVLSRSKRPVFAKIVADLLNVLPLGELSPRG